MNKLRDIPVDGNIDQQVVNDFGEEWSRLNQDAMPQDEAERQFNAYFAIFPWRRISPDAEGVDVGCGSGRWAKYVAPRVGRLHCVDPSEAIEVAKEKLKTCPNCDFHRSGVGALPFEDNSLDFGYSLGVLHHIPDTGRGIADCVTKLKPGAPFLIYLYYSFDNKPAWYKWLWKASDYIRKAVSALPGAYKYPVSQLFALFVYWPLARTALMMNKLGFKVDSWPLGFYKDKSFYMMRTDALDRLGTRLEKRFSRQEIKEMMTAAGLVNVHFSDSQPYHCAIGYKKLVCVE
ncbi:methyltransferase domain-containing protein [Hahella sp. KA22]|uniref:class I SAM-dependent methyltransferase n=1 Tax=Hahella sp. KA22 TaxID=1628392 RepID=UPI000FDD83C7|nr:class I SAM-dependent methyltransferase [Hahella sp. KA22]AZZ91682.1 class I SAM-dependent methyltransferase [Hahella sp. KA22]QAY55052.1 methyltransferase domain-containing protein [Hahella sp. KA22]